MVKSSEAFYLAFISGDRDLKTLAAEKGIKTSTACCYVNRHYDPKDARKIIEKLNINKDVVKRAYQVMYQSQVFRQENPEVQSAALTPYIYKELGDQCRCRRLASSLIRRLYMDTDDNV